MADTMSMRVVCVLLLFACLGAAAPANVTPVNAKTADLSQLNWLDLSLGEPQTDVFARYGEAGYHGSSTDGTSIISYTISHDHGNIYVVFEKARVKEISLTTSVWDGSSSSIADPHGITLSMSADDVIAHRGKSESTSDDKYGRHSLIYSDVAGTKWTYRFSPRGMQAITLSAPAAAIEAMPAATAPPIHGGTSFDDAVINGAEDERSGARNEYSYLISMRCLNGGGMWREDRQSLVTRDGHKYDVLNLKCYRSDETRDLYFQIDSFFGKM